MCTYRRTSPTGLVCVLFFLPGIILPSVTCQNAEPRGINSIRTTAEEMNLLHDATLRDGVDRRVNWNAPPEGENTPDENRRRNLASRETETTEAEVALRGDGNRNVPLLPLMETVEPRRNLSDTTNRGVTQENCEEKNRCDKGSRSTDVERSQSTIENGRETERRNKKSQMSMRRGISPSRNAVIRMRAKRRRGRKNRERKRGRKRLRENEEKNEGRRTKYKKRMNDAPASLLLNKVNDGNVDATKNNSSSNPLDGNSSLRKMNRVDRRNRNDSSLIPDPTFPPSVDQDRSTPSTTTRRPTSRRGGYVENVERELSKQLEREITRSGLVGRFNLDDRIMGPSYRNPVLPEISREETNVKDKDDKDKKELTNEVTSSAEERARFGNSRYNADKMLGYARTEEDLPILDLENEVLARTLKDYNAYMTSNLKFSTLQQRDENVHRNPVSSRFHEQPAIEDGTELERSRENSEIPDSSTSRTTNEYDEDNTKGDLSCINGTFVPAPLARHALIKYVKSSIPGHEYLEADYECAPGFYMVSSVSRLLCRNRQWVGQVPKCKVKRSNDGACAEAACEHVCKELNGVAVCSCYRGFRLDGYKCADVDECAVPDLQTEVCRYGCINTPGSYRCAEPMELKDQPLLDTLSITCLPGYEAAADGTCVDINECTINNGGCSEVCENTDGSYFCACDGDEKALSPDGKLCLDINNIACPPLNPAGRGYLMCTRSAMPKPWRGRQRTSNRPGTKCFLKCPHGYQLHGEYELSCRADGTWDGPKHGECVRYRKPRLECPKDVIAELPPGQDEAFVTFDQPATDLDWFRYVRSKPSWGTRLEANLKLGVHEITFFARHPVSKKQASCVLRIIVKGGEAPKVKGCPKDIEVTGKNGTTITWVEPVFTDNVKVARINSNESPGHPFDIGGHKVEYEASDEAGWSSKCVFTVVLRQE